MSGFYLVWCFGDTVDAYKCTNFISQAYPEEEVWPGEAQLMLLPESSCVCIPSFRSVAPRVCLAKATFLADC